MPLNFRQRDALGVLDWLFDVEGGRRSGRTLIMAVALIRQALRFPGRRIHLIDHAVHVEGRQRFQVIFHQVRGLIERDLLIRDLPWRFNRRGSDEFFWLEPTDLARPTGDSWTPDWLEGDPPPEPPPLGQTVVGRALAQERRLDAALEQLERGTLGDHVVIPTRYERMLADESLEPSE